MVLGTAPERPRDNLPLHTVQGPSEEREGLMRIQGTRPILCAWCVAVIPRPAQLVVLVDSETHCFCSFMCIELWAATRQHDEVVGDD